jgi:hypothetical protein
MRTDWRWWVPLVVTMALSACASSHSVMVDGQKREISMPDEPGAVIQMRRNGCPDQACPVYSIAIFSDGRATYDGRANVGVIGRRALELKAGDLSALITSLEAMDFLDTPDQCCVCPDDRPPSPVTLDYRPGTVGKTIIHDQRCATAPVAFSALESQIDRATAAERFTALPARNEVASISQAPDSSPR